MTNRQMIGYAMGDLGINLYFILVMTYLLYFYTDVLGISATAAAGVFGVARVIDAVTDPIMGLLAERTRSRYGRMRPYILFGALPLGLITILCFWVPLCQAHLWQRWRVRADRVDGNFGERVF